jgi:hypothetical protein
MHRGDDADRVALLAESEHARGDVLRRKLLDELDAGIDFGLARAGGG